MSKMKIGWMAFTAILIFAVVSPAASAAVVFEDDFSDLGDWKTYRISGIHGKAETSDVLPIHDGSYAKMTEKAWIRKEKIDTSGYENIYLSCYIRTNFQSPSTADRDKLQIEWRVGKSGDFEQLETIIEWAPDWTPMKWHLPSEACDKEEIQIQFKLENCEAANFACVDDVLVTDTPTGAPIPISAVDVGGHKIRFVSHTTDIGGNSIWTYEVTTGCSPSLSHWSIAWCGEKDDILYVSEGSEYHTDGYNNVDITGIKFDRGYECSMGTPETSTIWFKLKGDWHEGSVLIGTKAGHNEATGYVTGPVCTDPGIPEFTTIAIPVAALLGLVAFYRRKQKK
ncbi:MAG: PEF-CTERM sorting domain-containing protein [Methanosarcinales archaeon]|nr:PEF-CTERM sorting domain-containing protein [Methanosarcinales archaeon]